jgi:CheY-like chemotaxis protein
MCYSVLVVDDEALTLRTISRGLREEGFEAFTATSGEEALKIFEHEKPDLTLLDIVLPGIDGVEVLRRIKISNPAANRAHDERLPHGRSGGRSHEAGRVRLPH